jgi:putative sigma-54 modulation protein
MLIDITGNHIEITPALREHITKKLQKIEQKFPKITHMHVVLSIDNQYQHKAEVTAHLFGTDFHAHDTSEDMYASIDKMVEKLSKQIIKHKEKLKNHAADGSLDGTFD